MKNKKYNYKQEFESDNEICGDEIVCPYCFEEYEQDREFVEGDEEKLVCSSCGENFFANVHISYTYTSSKN